MMIAGEFNTPADWMRSGNAIPVIDDYSRSHGGKTPIFVFVDSGGSFNNDTECVNGPRGQAADHLTRDVRPFVVAQFGASADSAAWGVVGWSMGGTCAVDLTVMHPDLFHAFVDIAGDHGPTAGTKQQTVERLYAGDARQWNHYDPAMVMAEHGPYAGVAGWFADAASVATSTSNQGGHPARPQSTAPLGYGGHDVWPDNDRADASNDLCRAAWAVNIDCSVHSTPAGTPGSLPPSLSPRHCRGWTPSSAQPAAHRQMLNPAADDRVGHSNTKSPTTRSSGRFGLQRRGVGHRRGSHLSCG